MTEQPWLHILLQAVEFTLGLMGAGYSSPFQLPKAVQGHRDRAIRWVSCACAAGSMHPCTLDLLYPPAYCTHNHL